MDTLFIKERDNVLEHLYSSSKNKKQIETCFNSTMLTMLDMEFNDGTLGIYCKKIDHLFTFEDIKDIIFYYNSLSGEQVDDTIIHSIIFTFLDRIKYQRNLYC
jgi:hypothetical protein